MSDDFTLPAVPDYPPLHIEDAQPDAPIPFDSVGELALAAIFFLARYLVETNSNPEVVNPALRILAMSQSAYNKLSVYETDGLALRQQYERITGIDLEAGVREYHQWRERLNRPAPPADDERTLR